MILLVISDYLLIDPIYKAVPADEFDSRTGRQPSSASHPNQDTRFES